MKKTGKERLKKRHVLDVGDEGCSSADRELAIRRMLALSAGESSHELGVYCCAHRNVDDVVAMWEECYGEVMPGWMRESVGHAVSAGGEFLVSRRSLIHGVESVGDWDIH